MNHNKSSFLTLPALKVEDSRVSVGCFTYGAPHFMLWHDDERIIIGKYCSIAENVVIFGGGEHRSDWVTTFPIQIAFNLEGAWQDGHPANKGPTVIGNDVWLAYGSTILSGVKIGDGAIVGACSVVTTDIPSYAIVAGNPAKIIRLRFSQSIINRLIAIKWWDWPVERVVAAASYMTSTDIDKFLYYAENF